MRLSMRSPPYLELIEYLSPNSLDLIPTSLTCSPTSLSSMYEFLRIIHSCVSNDVNVDSGLMDNLFNMLKEDLIYDN